MTIGAFNYLQDLVVGQCDRPLAVTDDYYSRETPQ
jgi:hypothetical protein